jgi:GrpB-like predicted nucleotidyltransferase (UPF0157 family)
MSDEPVTLVDYDPAWPHRFAEQEIPLTESLHPWLAAPIEHVGSTAIPGLRAKPIIDILAPVLSLDEARAVVPTLQRNGWLFWPDDPNRFYRLWFLRPKPEARTHHLQIIQHDHPDIQSLLRFRDALRGDQELRRAYSALKDTLAQRFHSDRNGYSDAKSDFIRSVLFAVGAPAPSRRQASPRAS